MSQKQMQKTVMLLDDHPTFRRGLRRAIEEDGQFTVVAEAGVAYEALHLAGIHRPQLIVSDVQLPSVTGLKIARILKKQHPQTAIVMCSMDAGDERVLEAIRAGAAAFVRKDAEPDELIDTLQRVVSGERPIELMAMSRPTLAWNILRELAMRAGDNRTGPALQQVINPRNLSVREIEVLDCIAQGMSNKEIAETLYITEQTVKNHVTGLLRKIDADDRTQAILFAIHHGWVEYGSPNPLADPSLAHDGPHP